MRSRPLKCFLLTSLIGLASHAALAAGDGPALGLLTNFIASGMRQAGLQTDSQALNDVGHAVAKGSDETQEVISGLRQMKVAHVSPYAPLLIMGVSVAAEIGNQTIRHVQNAKDLEYRPYHPPSDLRSRVGRYALAGAQAQGCPSDLSIRPASFKIHESNWTYLHRDYSEGGGRSWVPSADEQWGLSITSNGPGGAGLAIFPGVRQQEIKDSDGWTRIKEGLSGDSCELFFVQIVTRHDRDGTKTTRDGIRLDLCSLDAPTLDAKSLHLSTMTFNDDGSYRWTSNCVYNPVPENPVAASCPNGAGASPAGPMLQPFQPVIDQITDRTNRRADTR